jgi:tetratricopeptide (TPR) repeat protein
MSKEEKKERHKGLTKEALRLKTSGNYRGAIAKYREAGRYGPLNRRGIGQCHQRLGDGGKAIQYYNEALKRTKNEKTAERLRGLIRNLGGTPVN